MKEFPVILLCNDATPTSQTFPEWIAPAVLNDDANDTEANSTAAAMVMVLLVVSDKDNLGKR